MKSRPTVSGGAAEASRNNDRHSTAPDGEIQSIDELVDLLTGSRARVAAVALVALSKEGTPSLGIRLLSDLRDVFGDRDAMSTEAILAALHDMVEAPWGDLRGKPLDQRGLANRLRRYGIKPRVVRIGNATPRGYVREELWDAWQRYLPPPPHGSATSATSATEPDPEALNPEAWR